MLEDQEIRGWIVDIVAARADVMAVAVRQRAKFENWLKFELACRAIRAGATDVLVEAPNGANGRVDLRIAHKGDCWHIELKTSNTNWRIAGVPNRHRPITKNIASIVADAAKLSSCPGRSFVAFVLLPVPTDDNRWTEYFLRITDATGLSLSAERHCSRVHLVLPDETQCDAIVCCFEVHGSRQSL